MALDVSFTYALTGYNTYQFTPSVSGGSGNYSYLWEFGDETTSTDASPEHEYLDSLPHNVILGVSDLEDVEAGFTYYYETVCAPPVISGSGIVLCGTATLDAGAGYDAYEWSLDGGGPFAYTQTIEVSTPGSYTVSTTLSVGGSEAPAIVYDHGDGDGYVGLGGESHYYIDVPEGLASLTITMVPESSDIDLYAGTVDDMYIMPFTSAVGGTDVEVITIDTTTTPPISAGRWYVVVYGYEEGNFTISTGASSSVCYKTSEPFEVTEGPPVVPPTISGAHSVCYGGGTTQLDAGDGYVTYSWSLDGVVIDPPETSRYINAAEGVYTVDAVDSNGCASSSDGFTVIEYPEIVPVISGDLLVCGSATTTLSAFVDWPCLEGN